jgi:hypothetical protein
VDDGAWLRQQALGKLRQAVSFATAGELHRAADFLDFAREVRSGKRRLRSEGKKRQLQKVREDYGYYAGD